ncbi:hypothetical protein CAC42_4317 [Sphaceloma murrayae]|uniref:Uncharacterized protein n=1 Tax=Sphaceloma murrayae TaxID=2082308 RepID=A0A2K1QL76_9PEZI|nr:hypothetical protein CAC42_4317 [Sphaceloma murrayae]
MAIQVLELLAQARHIELQVIDTLSELRTELMRLEMLYVPAYLGNSAINDFGFGDIATTIITTLRMFKQAFLDEPQKYDGLNFLDIRNQTSRAFCPDSIRELDLV